MTAGHRQPLPAATGPALLPPGDLPGLDPAWSRLVRTPHLDADGRTWHVLDTAAANAGETRADVTLLAIHGNPTWSYLWRDLLAAAPAGVRVVAPDHLDMGYSERTDTVRRLEQRIEDLCALTEELDLRGPVVTVAHDWGGPISLGWAARNQALVDGVVLMNTAVHQPEGSPVPALIRLVRARRLLHWIAVRTPLFVRGTLALGRPRPPAHVRAAYEAPYGSPERRAAVGAFVADIPLEDTHPSKRALDGVAAGLGDLDPPALLAWGAADPVFSDRYLHDLEARLSRADVHRFADAGHLIPEDADVASVVHAWVAARRSKPDDEHPSTTSDRSPLWAGVERRSADPDVAVVEMRTGGEPATLSFAALAADINRVAAGLTRLGVERGDRVALLVPPGLDLTVCLYACWRIGAVVVVADAGLGAAGIGRALRSADPAWLIGIPRALAAARVLRWPGRRIVTGASGTEAFATGAEATLDELRAGGTAAPLPTVPGASDPAAVAFTSGATGPAKGVLYGHRRLQAQRDALQRLYGITPQDRLVAAFPPFALFGPAMGIPSVVPEMSVTSPGTLRATALADAVAAVDATLVFASPAALVNVAATAGELDAAGRAALAGVRLLLSAGAPVPPEVLRSALRVMPNAVAHTPYGMTEVLPVADITLEQIDAIGAGRGVCVGRPVDGVEVVVDPLTTDGRPSHRPTAAPDVSGEVLTRAPHMRDGYDRLWATQDAADDPRGWHRSGDVGYLDADGRLWIEGRLAHVVTTPGGPVTPVAVEHAVEAIDGIHDAAVVGVGPPGTQHLVVVVVTDDPPRRPRQAPLTLADRLREVVPHDVAAVFDVPELPVDIRHNSKVDRIAIARWAERILAGERARWP